MSETLVNRFKRFMRELPAAEEIDSLPLPENAHTQKKADYFLSGRDAVIELKSLEEDPEYKAAREVDKHRSREDFPLFYGKWPLTEILKDLSDGRQIHDTILAKISRSVNRDLRNANEQVGSTKRLFHCAHAWGIVAILNETINILDPKIIASRLIQLLGQTNPNGAFTFANIHAAWVFAENFTVQPAVTDHTIPFVTVYRSDVEDNPHLRDIVDTLSRAWAGFNRVPIVHTPNRPLGQFEFIPRKRLTQTASGMIPRHEAWRRAYRKERYLGSLSDEALLQHGAKLLNSMTPYLLKGGPRAPREVMGEFWRGVTHFFEECDCRHLDLKPLHDLLHTPEDDK